MNCFYKRSVLEEDSSSVASIHLSEGVTVSATRVRYHPGIAPWKGRTKIEKCLIVLSSFLTAVVLFLLLRPKETINSTSEDYCMSDDCVHTAWNILSSLNRKVDPCDDFYEFSCGNWDKYNPIPDGRSMWGTFNKLEQTNQIIVKQILDSDKFDKSECMAERKAKNYYVSCLDVNETIESLGAKPLKVLLEKTGGWNAVKAIDIDGWDFQKALQLTQNEYNMGGFFSWSVGIDDKNSTAHVIQIDQGGLTLPTREYYLNRTNYKKIFDAYLTYMTTIGVLLGGEEKDVKDQMSRVLDMEAELANIMAPEDDRDAQKLYKKITVETLHNISDFVDWEGYLADAFRRINYTITKKHEVVIYAEPYLRKMSRLLKKYMLSKRDKITLHNYLAWQMVRTMTSYMSKPFRDAYKVLRKVLYGSDGSVDSWRFCITDTNGILGFALGALYVHNAFKADSKTDAKAMINNVRAAFTENFKNLKWMNEETRKLAKLKADAIADMIGYPNFILNSTELDKKYDGLTIEPDQYFMNNIRANQFKLKDNLKNILYNANETKWFMMPSTVNAYYTPNKNQIVFPAGILQAPFYDKNQFNSLNYGAIGVVMGHELTHGFDENGREYDRYGNMNQWWDNETIAVFKKQTQCFVNQYNKYAVEGRLINGQKTLGENIADNGGLKAAYHAYRKIAKKSKTEPRLPGLDYDQNQLFFISFAQVWCLKTKNESLQLQIDKDMHSPSPYRVNGPVANLKEFAEVFSCPPNCKMNPSYRCEVW